MGKFNPPNHTYIAKVHLQKAPQKIADNGDEVDMISKGDVNLKTGWYYEEDEEILWIRSAVKNTTGKEWKITLK